MRDGAEKLTVCSVQGDSGAAGEGPEQHAKGSTLVHVLFGSVPTSVLWQNPRNTNGLTAQFAPVA